MDDTDNYTSVITKQRADIGQGISERLLSAVLHCSIWLAKLDEHGGLVRASNLNFSAGWNFSRLNF